MLNLRCCPFHCEEIGLLLYQESQAKREILENNALILQSRVRAGNEEVVLCKQIVDRRRFSRVVVLDQAIDLNCGVKKEGFGSGD